MPKNNPDNSGISGPGLDAREEKLLRRKEKLDALWAWYLKEKEAGS